jgi:hypothetical protein
LRSARSLRCRPRLAPLCQGDDFRNGSERSRIAWHIAPASSGWQLGGSRRLAS